MHQVLTLNIAFELFGLFFCLVCISISALSQNGIGKQADSANDIRNLFICDAFVMFLMQWQAFFAAKRECLPHSWCISEILRY